MSTIKVGDKIRYRDGEVSPVIEVLENGSFRVSTKVYGTCVERLKGHGGAVELYWSAPDEPSRIATPAEMASIHRNVLPTDAAKRNAMPMADGLLYYFPNALAAVSALSKVANEQHNPGEPMHWARNKSHDHANKIIKHLVDAGGFDADGQRHSAKVAWRALALLEDELIAAGAVPGRNAIGSPGALSKPQQRHDVTPPWDVRGTGPDFSVHNCIEDET